MKTDREIQTAKDVLHNAYELRILLNNLESDARHYRGLALHAQVVTDRFNKLHKAVADYQKTRK